ncbi:MAG: MFS transporter [Chloroflexota bacterium]
MIAISERKPSGVSRLYAEYRTLLWVCLLIFTSQIGFGSIVPVVPLYAQAFGVPQSAIGLTIGIFGLARFLLSVPSGNVADTLGRRWVLAMGGLLTVGGNLLSGLADGYVSFLVARFVAGCGASFIITGCQIVLADISTPEKRGRMMSVYQGTFMFAVGSGPYPGGLLAESFGLSAPFFANAILGAAVSALAWFAVPETRGMRAGRVVSVTAKPPPFIDQLRIMSGQSGFMLISLVSFMNTFARTGALFNLIPILGKDRLGLTTDQIGLSLSAVSVFGLLMAYPSGWLSDRYGRKRIIVPSATVMGLAFLVFPVAPSFGWFMVGCMTWSLATGTGGAAQPSYAADVVPPGMNAAAMSSFRALADMGYVAGPILLGLVADVAGVNAALYATSVMVLGSTALFAVRAKETHRRSAATPSGRTPA